MADPTAAEMVSRLKAKIYELANKSFIGMQEQDRSTQLQDIKKLREELEFWEARAAAESSSSTQKTSMFTRGFCKL